MSSWVPWQAVCACPAWHQSGNHLYFLHEAQHDWLSVAVTHLQMVPMASTAQIYKSYHKLSALSHEWADGLKRDYNSQACYCIQDTCAKGICSAFRTSMLQCMGHPWAPKPHCPRSVQDMQGMCASTVPLTLRD
eukprot:1972583-Amphidinium_carterae.1